MASAYVVSSGQSSSGISLNSGDTLTVYSGGTAVDTTVSSGGFVTVDFGGSAASTTVKSGGVIDTDGTDAATIVSSGGIEEVYEGTTSGAVIDNGGVEVVYGGVEDVLYYGSAVGTVVVDDYGSATGTVVASGGTLIVLPDGVALSTVMQPGGSVVSTGVVLLGLTSVKALGNTASNLVVSSGSTEFILSDGTATSTRVSSGGGEIVSSGGRASGTMVSSAGYQAVSAGAGASATTLRAGWEYVSYGGVAVSTTVSAAGVEFVYSGGTAIGTVIQSGGFEAVRPRGTASGTVVESGGTLIVLPGARVSGTVVQAGGAVVSTGVIVLKPQAVPLINNFVFGEDVSGETEAFVLSGGTGAGTTLTAGGQQVVYAGGFASGAEVGNDGTESVSSGGSDADTSVGDFGVAYVSAGGSALFTQISSGGAEYVASSGTVIDATLSRGGNLGNYGTEFDTTVRSGGIDFVYSGAAASFPLISNGGIEALWPGASATSGTVESGGTEIVLPGAIATALSVQSGGTVVSAGIVLLQPGPFEFSLSQSVQLLGSKVSNLVVDNGALFILAGGTAIGTTVENSVDAVDSGGAASGTVVGTDGEEHVSSGGRVVSTRVGNAGSQAIVSGGTASFATVSAGGTESVYAGGTASGSTVDNLGLQIAYGGANVAATTVSSGGTEAVLAGAVTSTRLAVGGTIDLPDLPFVGTAGATLNTTTGVLTVVQGGTTASLPLLGPLTGEGFRLASDATSGTEVLAIATPTEKTWVGGATSGSFLSGANWSLSGVPGTLDDVLVSTVGADVTVPAGSTAALAINSLNLIAGATFAVDGGQFVINDVPDTIDASGNSFNAGTIAVAGAVLDLAGTVRQTGAITVSGAGGTLGLPGGSDLVGGTLAAVGGGHILTGGATLDGSGTLPVTIAAHTTVTVDNGSSLTALGTIDNAGVLLVDSLGAGASLILGSPTVTLIGGGVLALYNHRVNSVHGLGATSTTLINVDDTIAGDGQLGVVGSIVTPLVLINQAAGTIDASYGYGLYIDTGGPAVTNTGLIEATGGPASLQFGGGTTINNTGGEILAGGVGITLPAGMVITGGTLAASGAGQFVSDGATLDGSGIQPVTVAAGATVSTTSQLSLLGTIALYGQVDLDGSPIDPDLIIASPTVSLTGGGAVLMANFYNYIYGASPTNATLVNVDDTIAGGGDIGIGATANPLVLVNLAGGTIDADSGYALYINTGGPVVTNAGLIEATGSGSLQFAVGTTIGNSGGEVLADGVGVTLPSGMIVAGGTLAASNGGQIQIANTTLDGGAQAVTIAAAATVAVDDAHSLTILGTLDDLGTLVDDASETASYTGIIVGSPTAMLTGGGVVQLSDSSHNFIGAAVNGDTLVNVVDTIAGAGVIGATSGNVGLALVNDAGGTVDATGSVALVIQISGPTVVNAGLMEATGDGTLVFSGGVVAGTGGGTISGNGATVALSGVDLLGGTLVTAGAGAMVIAGTTTLDGSLTTLANRGLLQVGAAATSVLRGAIANSGTIRLASAGVVQIGTAAGDTAMLTGGGTVNLAGGVISTAGGLTDVDNSIVGSGSIGGAGSLAIGAAGVVEGSGGTLALTAATSNAGTITASSGGVTLLAGKVTGSAGGDISANAGLIELSGADLAGGSLLLSPGTVHVIAASTLDGTAASFTNQALVQIDPNQTLTLLGTIVNSGALQLGSAGSALLIGGGATLGGGGNVGISAGEAITGSGRFDDLNDTISGSGSVASSLSLVLGSGAVLDGDGAGLRLGAATTNAGLLEAAGGTLQIAATVIDAGGGIAADGGLVSLAGADLVGGTLSTAGSGTILVGTASTFDGSAAAVADSGLVEVGVGSSLSLLGGFANAGTLAVGGGALVIGSTATASTTTLSGGGTVVLGGSLALVSGASAGDILDNAGDSIVGAGSLGGGGLGLVNAASGVIAATRGTMVLDPGGAGTIANAGLIAADTVGLTIGEGSLANTGTLAALDATLSAQAAVNDLADRGGTLTGGTWLASSTTAAATLALGGGLVSDDDADIILSGSAAMFLSGPSATALEQSLLEISPGGLLRLQSGRSFVAAGGFINLGTLMLTAGTFATTGTGGLVNDALIDGTGTLGGSVANAGTIEATADPLTLGPVGGGGELLVGAGGGSMVLTGVAAGGTAAFAGAGGMLTIDDAAGFAATVSGFINGDIIDLANIAGINTVTFSQSTGTQSTGTLSLFAGQVVTAGSSPTVPAAASLMLAGTYTTASFAVRPDGGSGTDIFIPCFLAGTSLLTTRGEVAVEHLRAGDRAVTPQGCRPVVWIGQRVVACDRHPMPALVRPVRIAAGAFAPSRPRRDLWLSPDHAVAWDGVLIPIKHLVNGATIVPAHFSRAHYYHVELDAHDVVLAEGLPVESFLDTGNRTQFTESGGCISLHPEFSRDDRDRAWAPLCSDGPRMAAARRHLLARAGALGYRRGAAELWVEAGGRCRRAARIIGRLHRFLLPARTGEITIRSSVGVPAAEDPAAGDCRSLGARIEGIAVGGRCIGIETISLSQGFFATERDDALRWRWTDGAARLSLPRLPAPVALDLLVHQVMSGRVRPHQGNGANPGGAALSGCIQL